MATSLQRSGKLVSLSWKQRAKLETGINGGLGCLSVHRHDTQEEVQAVISRTISIC